MLGGRWGDGTPPTVISADLVPVAERQRWVGWLRVAVAGTIVGAALGGATPLVVRAELLIAVTGLYLVGLFAVQEWRRSRHSRGTAVMGLALLVDGLYLVWATTITGAFAGIAPMLVLFHVVGVTLLLSYRTGVKVAVWHALLLYAVFELQEAGVVRLSELDGTPFGWLVAYFVVVGVVAAGTASFSAVNERELRRQRSDLEVLADLATEFEKVDTPGQVARVLVDRVQAAFPFPRVAVVGGADATEVLATAGVSTPAAELSPAGTGSALRRACRERRTQLVRRLDPVHDPGLETLLPDATTVAIVFLPNDGGALQALVAEHRLRRGARVARRVVRAVERCADHGALALRAATLLQEVRTLATIDTLTGAVVRRVFDDALQTELSRACRTGGTVGVLLLDVDRFKDVNDVHGHQTGDRVLRRIGDELRAHSRDFDVVARYGGEEFAILAPGCDERAARELAERVRAAIQRASSVVPVTASVGVAVGPGQAATADGLVALADDALFRAKRAGRNRVAVAEPPPVPVPDAAERNGDANPAGTGRSRRGSP